MNVLLIRARTDEVRAAIRLGAPTLAGQAVFAKPGGNVRAGRVTRAWVDGDELWADLEMERAFLPHEMFLDKLSIGGA